MDTEVKFTNSARYKCLEYLKQKSVDLYLAYCGKEICDSGHSYGPTIRTEYLLHYIIEGKGSFTANNQTYNLKKYDAFLIFPDEPTYYEADLDTPWTYVWIAFHGHKALESLIYAGFHNEKRIQNFSSEAILVHCINEMLDAHQLTYANDLIRQSYLQLFLATIIKEYQEKNETSNSRIYSQQVYIDHALDYISHNFNKNIKIADIANYIGINRSYLTSCFRKILDCSPQEYLFDVRMNKACTLLKATSLPINHISDMVGYSDALSFSKVFKSKYGESPKSYRARKETLVLSSKKHE